MTNYASIFFYLKFLYLASDDMCIVLGGYFNLNHKFRTCI